MRATPGFQAAFLAVYDQLSAWENGRLGYTQPAQGVIGRALGLARETVNRAVAWLRKHGFIKTKQRYVRQDDKRSLYGTLRYWIAKELGQVQWLKGQFAAARARAWADAVNNAARRQEAQAARAKRDAEEQLNRLQIEAARLDALRKYGCDMGLTVPSTTESNSDRLDGENRNLASPALQRLLKEKRWRG